MPRRLVWRGFFMWLIRIIIKQLFLLRLTGALVFGIAGDYNIRVNPLGCLLYD